jgi:deoxyribose-phosphate aldolase
MMESLTTYEAFAARVSLTVLNPELAEKEAALGCELAKRLGLRSVTVRPCDIDVAVRILSGSAVIAGSVAGFPHGDSNTGVKLYEARDLLRRGAREIDMTINISKLRSRQFQYVDMEVMQMSEACRKEGATLRITLETGYLSDEEKIVACRMCGRAEVPVVKTATGFGPPALASDIALLRKHLPEDAAVEAAGTDTLELAREAFEAGAARVSTANPAPLLSAWRAHLAALSAASVPS